jgi:hypothetical protein
MVGVRHPDPLRSFKSHGKVATNQVSDEVLEIGG